MNVDTSNDLLLFNNLIYVPEEQQSDSYGYEVVCSTLLSTRGRQAQLLVIVGDDQLLSSNNPIYVPQEPQSVSYRLQSRSSTLLTAEWIFKYHSYIDLQEQKSSGSIDCQEYCNERTDYSALATTLTKQWVDNLQDITGKLIIDGDIIKLKNMRSMSFESFTPEQVIEKRIENIDYNETDEPVVIFWYVHQVNIS